MVPAFRRVVVLDAGSESGVSEKGNVVEVEQVDQSLTVKLKSH